jgi:hypothetical protein
MTHVRRGGGIIPDNLWTNRGSVEGWDESYCNPLNGVLQPWTIRTSVDIVWVKVGNYSQAQNVVIEWGSVLN